MGFKDAKYNHNQRKNNLSMLDITQQIKNIPIDVKQHGVKGDGVTDDTIALTTILNTGDHITYTLSDGNYLISDTLRVNTRNTIILSKNARIFTNTPLVDLVVYNDAKTNGIAIKTGIYGGALDGNDICENILTLGNYAYFALSEVQLLNYTKKGLITKSTNSTTHNGMVVDKVVIRNFNQAHLGTTGIYNNANDNKFRNIEIVDIETGINSLAFGLFETIHHWLHYMELYENSKFAHSQNSYTSFSGCVVDTIRVAFTNIANSVIKCSDIRCFVNINFATQSVQEAYPFTFFGGVGEVNASQCSGYFDYGTNVVSSVYSANHRFVNCSFTTGVNGTFDKTNYNPIDDITFQLFKGYINNPDLDNYKTLGFYRIGTITSALNLPVNEAGELEVKVFMNAHGTDKIVKQVYYLHTNSRIFYQRGYNGSTWTSWYKFDNDNYEYTINNPDFNAFKTIHSVYKIMDTTTSTNYPAKVSGTLVVEASGASGVTFTVQKYYPLAFTGLFYIRTYNEATDTWTAWVKFENASNDITVNNPDFNSYKFTNSVFKIMDTTSAINYPAKVSGTLIVRTSGISGVAFTVQKYYPLAFVGVFYVRTYTESTNTWSAWYSFTGAIVS